MLQRNIFTAEAGSQSAIQFLEESLRSPDFPRKFRPRGEKLLRSVRSFDADLDFLADVARSKMAENKTSRQSRLDPASSLSWAAQGLDNAAADLRVLVRTDRTISPLLKTSELLLSELRDFAKEVQEYLSSPHPIDWLEETYGDLVEGLRGRPALVASRWASRNAESSRRTKAR